ncbi:MAG: GNAT family N-acetyltransferase [Bacteroidaceae bacterium]|nr:GNAT family N-acetyltransferase [Bacteroidaceae bacterium]
MNTSFLSDEEIYLRAVEPEDLDLMYEMENSPELWFVSSTFEPYSRHMLREYILSSQNDVFADKQLRLIIVRKSDQASLGTLDLDSFDPLHRRANIGIALRKEYRGNGYAQRSIELICDYALQFLHFHQLVAYVPVNNKESMDLFTRCGFVQKMVLSDWLITPNGYQDVALFQCIEP